MFVFSGFFIVKIYSIQFQIEGFLCSGISACQPLPGMLIVPFFFLSFTVLPASAWNFQPTMAAPGPCSTPSVCLRYVLGPICPTAPSTPLKTTAGESVLCNPNWDAGLEKEMNYGWQEGEGERTTLYHLSFLTGWAQQGRSVLVFLAAQ